jgi:hypothetical protein
MIPRWVAVVIAAGWAGAVHAETTSTATAHLGLASSPVQLPGLGRVVGVFVGVVALAVALALAMRRLSPWLPRRLQVPAEVTVTVLARQSLDPGVHLYVVNVAAERLAIVTSRTGIAVHALHGVAGPAAPENVTR